MSSLYEINQEILTLLNDEELIDDEQAFNDTMQALQIERYQKIDDWCSYIKNLKAWAESCNAEAKALKERAERYQNKALQLTERLGSYLELREKFSSSKNEIRWRKSSSTVVTVPPEELPESYRRVSVQADKTAIKAALVEKGLTIPGCTIVHKTNLNIK